MKSDRDLRIAATLAGRVPGSCRGEACLPALPSAALRQSIAGSDGEPRRPVPGLVPEHGEERLVEREVALPAVARVDEVDVRLVEAHLDGQHVGDERHPRDGCVRVRCGAVPGEAVVERATARLDDDRHDVQLGAFGRGVARGGEPVLRRMELRALRRRLRPEVRAPDVLDRAGVRGRLVQRDPAGQHLRRHEVVGVRRVLMEADRLRPRGLPEDVVLQDPRAAVARELGTEAPRALRQHLRGDHVVGSPAVADLARPVLGIASRHPVDLVGLDPGLVDALEERLVALAQQVERARRDEALLDDQEAVAVEALDLLVREDVDHDRGRSFSGS